MKRKNVALTATAGAAAGVLGLTVLTLPAGAGASPSLPPIAPEQLVESVISAAPPALTGTVQVNNALGLPALPGAGEASGLLSNGTSQFQVWADGHGRHRASIPSQGGELTVVNDGSTVWKWDSRKRTASRTERPESKHPDAEHGTPPDPSAEARRIIDTLRQSSNVAVDGTASVAGRDAYELVLTPKPTERTVLREVRVAVDAEKRIPLELVVNTNGSSDPALKVGFTRLDLAPPEPGLFQFTPPAGAKVEQEKRDGGHAKPPQGERKVVGDGWDTVMVTRVPEQQPSDKPKAHGGKPADPRQMAERVGKRISGPWGEGWVISTKAGTALLTSDGRLAVGAVPEQVLTSAIGNA
jgi:outer membrane lipoprotein-sorting protein